VAIDAVAAVLIRIGQLAIDHPEIRELDINPLLADAGGVVALDTRLRVAAPTSPRSRLAIPPYPKALEATAALRDGTRLRLRPIKPEDEPLLHDLIARMKPEDIRYRFFSPLKRVSHQLAARLSQIDYDREMALVAVAEQSHEMLGVARFAADPDNRLAEYGVMVRSDWQGRGLGYLLMFRLIDVARARGIGELTGSVLRDNEAMLRMCRELGFSLATHPQDPTIVEVRMSLSLSQEALPG
jgi:acetyltransferase